jgi:hypothetical protein
MKRSDLNFTIDALAFIGLVLLIVTGLIMRFVLPPFKGGHRGETGPSLLWGWDRHQWGDFHFWIAAGLMVVLVVHLFLHWKWIVSVVQGKPREGSGIRVSLGILSLVILMVVALSPFFSPTEQKPRRGKQSVLEKIEKKPIEENKPVRKAMETPVDLDVENTKENESSVSVKGTHSKGIRGSMTLSEIEKTTGVPVTYVLEKLKLPEDTDPESRLGRLRNQYGFAMHDVRKFIANYKK